MKIKNDFRHLDGKQAWETVIAHVMADNVVTTVTGIRLTATFVGSCIYLKCGTTGTKSEETFSFTNLTLIISAYDSVKDWEEINTGNVKPYIRRQQTPFIALLYCAGILE